MTLTIIQLARLYRANPFRPHCQPGRHVWLCRLIMPRIGMGECGRV